MTMFMFYSRALSAKLNIGTSIKVQLYGGHINATHYNALTEIKQFWFTELN